MTLKLWPILPGDLLVAHPTMVDSSFEESVVLICQADENGFYGLILNRPIAGTNVAVGLPNDWPEASIPIAWGGPVGVEQLQAIHNDESISDNCSPIIDELRLGGELEQFSETVAKGRMLRFFMGYAGWEVEQLQNEINSGGWLCLRNKSEIAFSTDLSTIWSSIISKYFPNSLRGEIDPTLN